MAPTQAGGGEGVGKEQGGRRSLGRGQGQGQGGGGGAAAGPPGGGERSSMRSPGVPGSMEAVPPA